VSFEDTVVVGEAEFKQRRAKNCRHLKMLYCTVDRTVECRDCGAYVSPFNAFLSIVKRLDYAWREIRSAQKALQEMKQKSLVLRAAKHLEQQWRKRKFVPACPHCRQAIFPDQALAMRGVNKDHAAERRKFLESQPSMTKETTQ